MLLPVGGKRCGWLADSSSFLSSAVFWGVFLLSLKYVLGYRIVQGLHSKLSIPFNFSSPSLLLFLGTPASVTFRAAPFPFPSCSPGRSSTKRANEPLAPASIYSCLRPTLYWRLRPLPSLSRRCWNSWLLEVGSLALVATMPGSLVSRTEVTLFVLFSLISVIRGECGTPPKLKNAVPLANVDAVSFPTDTGIIYSCLDGFYNVRGKLDVTTCLSNSYWSHIEDFCESSCPLPALLRYAQPTPEAMSRSYYTPGTTVSYICRRGYDSIPGMSPVVTCLQNNTWTAVPVFCKGKSCGNPGKPQNGRAVILTDVLYRAKVNFTCDEGYRLIGSLFTQCLVKNDTVKWNKDPPDCQPITCSSPPNITGGTHDGGGGIENFPYNSTVTYRCDNGFLLIGEASIHCTTEDKVKGIWSGPAPECKDMTVLTTPIPSSQEVEKHISSAVLVICACLLICHNFFLIRAADTHNCDRRNCEKDKGIAMRHQQTTTH